MSGPGRAPRLLLAAVVAAGLLHGAFRGIREFRGLSAPRPAEAARRAFLAECVSRIPPDARVHLVADPRPYLTSTELYPRGVRLLEPDLLPALRRDEPEAWVVVLGSPFDRARAFVGRARELP